jgi:hypothetical protein
VIAPYEGDSQIKDASGDWVAQSATRNIYHLKRPGLYTVHLREREFRFAVTEAFGVLPEGFGM